ncbi:MAG: aryl-sulfate sulfotransferase [candidate division WOR-3 bacterium]
MQVPVRFRSLSYLFIALALFCGIALANTQRTMGLIYRDSSSTELGYTLFQPQYYNVTYLIDMDGMLVHSWTGRYNPGLSVNLCENGLLLRTCAIYNYFGALGGRVELVDWDGNVVWSYNYSNYNVCQHHDAIMLPNGNILMIAWERKTRSEAIAAGRDPNLLIPNALWPDHLVEVDPDNNGIVWEWHLWDHLIQDYDSTKANYGNPREHPELVDINFTPGGPQSDWNHCNSVAYNPELDQVVISSRHLSEIWVIDHSTTIEESRSHSGGRYGKGGDLLYRWGNPASYRREGTIPQTLFVQHDAQWIAPGLPGAGNMLVFNNGTGRNMGMYSSVDEFVPPMDSLGFYHLGEDSAYGPEAPVWRYTATPRESLYSPFMSGCQRLPNGNTLICDAGKGTFLEVTSEGRLVWKYINPVTSRGPQEQGQVLPQGSNSVFKVRRYPPDYPGLAGRNLDPIGPIETYPQGVYEQPAHNLGQGLCPAVVHSFITLSGAESAELVDITGRIRMRLTMGKNDIRHLPAGVYFVVTQGNPKGEKVIVRR